MKDGNTLRTIRALEEDTLLQLFETQSGELQEATSVLFFIYICMYVCTYSYVILINIFLLMYIVLTN